MSSPPTPSDSPPDSSSDVPSGNGSDTRSSLEQPQSAVHRSCQLADYADRLGLAVSAKGTPLIVGLDPRVEQLPRSMWASDQPSQSLAAFQIAPVYQQFCCEVIDVVADWVAAVKPQAAFFEALGPHGMQALANVTAHAVSKGLLVIMDAKRGDIGSTATAYAEAYLGRQPLSIWGCDALTVNPYLGDDSLSPFVDAAKRNGAGIYVLVKTSNPGSGMLQERIADGQPIYRHVADHLEQLSLASIASGRGELGYGAVGAVVGATYPEQLAELRSVMPHVPLLIPGFGAQGGTARDVATGFDERGHGAVVNSSRAIIFAHQQPAYEHLTDWQTAVEQATRLAIDQLATDTPAGRLRQGTR